MKTSLKNISTIDLDDSQQVRIDEGKKAVAYFCQKGPARVDRALIEELRIKFLRDKLRNLRLCLHSDPDADIHEMVIFEWGTKYGRPHKHLKKGEVFHIIEGKMGVLTFTDAGEVIDACIMEASHTLMYKVCLNVYHATVPLSDYVIYHESRPGPFRGEQDSLYPEWAPDGSCESDIKKYTAKLKSYLTTCSAEDGKA